VELKSVVVVVVDSVDLDDDNTQTFMTALKTKVKQGCKFVLCVLPSNRKDRYDAIKVYLCCDNPVPSQMILDKTLSTKNMMSVATKVAIQINCKMGGEVWKLEIPVSTSTLLSLSNACRLAERSWVFNWHKGLICLLWSPCHRCPFIRVDSQLNVRLVWSCGKMNLKL